jgi:hypothetical protein
VRPAYFDNDALARYFSNTYGNKLTFLALSILYPDYNWGSVASHQDHIFPKDMFSLKSMKSAGFNVDKMFLYAKLRDRLGNLELLSPDENKAKSNQPFDKWLKTRDDSFKKRHLIPDVPELWKFENFESFIKKREELIEKRLKKLFGPPDTKEA